MTWTAFAQITRNDDGLFNVYCPTVGSTEEEAKAAAEFVLKALAEGKFRFIRKKPTAGSEQSYETKAVEHKGFVRFGFKDEPGDEQVLADYDGQMICIGDMSRADVTIADSIEFLVQTSLDPEPSQDVTVEIQPLAVEGEAN